MKMTKDKSNDQYRICKVEGVNPVTRKKCISNLFSDINAETIEDIFQTDLSHKFSEGVFGSKAVIYQRDNGEYQVAFLSETINTHHRHALATLVGLESPKARAFYEGDCEKSQDLLDRSAGFELQYDYNSKKIIGIQQDSWITKRQIELQKKISIIKQEDMVLELLNHIDPAYLSNQFKNVEIAEDPYIIRREVA